MSTKARAKPAAIPPTPLPDGVELLKLGQAAYLLQVSERSVRRLVDAGQLAAHRVTVGGSLRVHPDEVRRFVRESRFVERPEAEVAPEDPAGAAQSREKRKASGKAEWNTGEDPFAETPKRKGRGAKP